MASIVVIGPFPPRRGGIAQHSANVLEALVARGHEVTAVGWTHLYPRLLYRRPQFDGSADSPDVQRRLSWWNPISWIRVRQEIRAVGADILWMPWVTPFHALTYRVLVGAAPTVVHVHNAVPHESFPVHRPLTRWALRQTERFIVHAETIANDLHDIGLRQPATVTPHPPNLTPAITPQPDTSSNRILFLGFVRPYKGLDTALEALALLPIDYHLTVAGEFWGDQQDWTTMIDHLDLADRVDVRAWYQSDDEVGALLETHHVLVLPYKSATQSGLAPLAFAAGRPVVASDVGGLAEAVEDGVSGILVPADDGAALAQGVQRAFGDLEALSAGAARAGSTWLDYADVVGAGGVD